MRSAPSLVTNDRNWRPPTRLRERWSWPIARAVALVIGVSLLLGACTDAQLIGQSPAYLIIESLEAASGSEAVQFANTLRSDVMTNGSVLEDPGRVVFSLGLKDAGSVDRPLTPSTTNFITVTRYHVRYVRSDGRNTPGVHVPYAFDGGMTVTVDGDGAEGTLVLVRVQSKLEAPLVALRDLGGAVAISTVARVTFFGRDQAGRDVSATGEISVNFADWADPAQ